MAVLNNSALVGAAGKGGTGAITTPQRSIRLNYDDQAFFSRTPSSAGNRRTWTFSAWVKRSKLGYYTRLLNQDSSGNCAIQFVDNDVLRLFDSTIALDIRSAQVFRDPSAWYHIFASLDTTQATASNRASLYVNGTKITSLSTANYPAQNAEAAINLAAAHGIGNGPPGEHFGGYLANIHFIDGQALTPSAFGYTDPTTGRWEPKAYAGSYSGNSFYLDFSDNSAATATTLGADRSGLGNNWVPNNLSVITGGPTSVAAASGALPIYNTTDTYGATKGTGTRTDSNSSSIVLALPMDGANGGTSFGDQSATIKGSGSAKTITVTNATTSTSLSKFYGSSGNFNGSSYLTTDLSSLDYGSNWTVEFWWYKSGTATGNHAHFLGGTVGGTQSYGPTWRDQGSNDWQFNINGTSTTFAQFNVNNYTNQWHHYAFVRNGGTLYYYVDGVLRGSSSVSFTGNWGTSTEIGRGGPGWSGQYVVGNVQDYRIYQGVKYTGNFNPPSSTADTTIAAGNDSLRDTPVSSGIDTGLGGEVTGNYCTLNPLNQGANSSLVNGNLDWTRTSNGYSMGLATIAVSSGKWYWEYTLNGSTNNAIPIGVVPANSTATYPGEDANSVGYNFNGTKVINTAQTSYGSSIAAGDVVGVAFDATNGTVVFYKNGTSQGTATSALTSGPYCPAVSSWASGTGSSLNFGQRPWAYPGSVPAGFKALCDTNLTPPTIVKPATVFDTKLYTGNGSTQTISGLGFSPDLVWTKHRNGNNEHALVDVVRGVQQTINSDRTIAEYTTGSVTAFNSDGFNVGSSVNTNYNGAAYVGWCWDAGSSSPATNNSGSIQSTVKVNTSAGFSIVRWNANNTANQSIGHGLNVTPAFIIHKNRTTAGNWNCWFTGFSNDEYINLNGTGAKASTGGGLWYQTPTSSLFYIGFTGSAINNSTDAIISYCFAPVAGYSAMGSWVASDSGNFVYTGFRPAFLLAKNISVGDGNGTWIIRDNKRGATTNGNPTTYTLFPQNSDAERDDFYDAIDFVSNGFVVKAGTGNFSNYAGTHIYYAVAEAPFQYARAK